MKRGKLSLILLMVTTLLGTVTAFVQTSGTTVLNISKDSNLNSGEVAEIIPLQDTFTVSRGAAKQQSQVKLYKILLGNPRYSPKISIQILNLDDLAQSLRNPNAYIDVQVWYPTDDATWNATNPENRALIGGDKVVRDTGEKASARLSRVVGDVMLRPTAMNVDTLYVLADIFIPRGTGGKPSEPTPPAVPQLKFYCEVRA